MAWSQNVYINTITQSDSVTIDIPQDTYIRFSLQFSEDMDVVIYSDGYTQWGLDVRGSLLDSNGSAAYDPDDPFNSSYLASDDDSASNNRDFRFSYGPCSANNEYYLYVQGYQGAGGRTSIFIDATPSTSSGAWDMDIWDPTYYVENGSQIDFQRGLPAEYTLCCLRMRFEEDAVYHIFANASVPLYAYISDVPAIDDVRGEPLSILAYDTSSDDGFNLTFTPASSVRNYYLFVRTATGEENPRLFTARFTTEGGGGGSWSYDEYSAVTMDDGDSFYYSTGALGEYTTSIRPFYVSTSGTVTIETRYSAAEDIVAFITTSFSFDDETGDPTTDIVVSDTGRTGDFYLSFSANNSTLYYLYVRTYTGEGSTESFSADLTIQETPAEEWRYNEIAGLQNISATTTKTVFFTSLRGSYFSVTFSSTGTATISIPSSADADLFVTDGMYSYNSSTGYPYDSGYNPAVSMVSHTINVSAGSYYYVWLKGYSSSSSGSVVITFEPQAQPSGWTRVYEGDVDVVDSTRSEPLTIRAYETYAYRVRFSTAGTPRIYSTGNVDVIAYFSDTNYSINPDTGVPIAPSSSAMKVWDDASSGNSNFDSDRDSPTVASDTWYYLWVKVYSASYATGPIVIYFVPPTPAPTGTNIWIYTGSGSSSGYARVARCWVFNGSLWVQVTKPWLYTNTW